MRLKAFAVLHFDDALLPRVGKSYAPAVKTAPTVPASKKLFHKPLEFFAAVLLPPRLAVMRVVRVVAVVLKKIVQHV
jgi:hypothetical protein